METLSGKRILFVITKSNWGGAQSYVYTLAKHYQGLGASVSVALGGTGVLTEKLKDARIPVHSIPSLGRDISFFKEWESFFELVRIVRREKPDVLHVNSGKAGAIGALAGRLTRVPRVVFTAHGWSHQEPRPLLWKILVWKASWLTVLFSHAVIAVSAHDQNRAPALFLRHKVHLVHNGVAPFALAPRVKARQELIQKAPTLSETVPWLLMPAELHTNKGIDTAIGALAHLSPSYPDAALVVLGEGEERERLLQWARKCEVQDRVFLLGFVPNAKQYLGAADIFLMPSRKEGFPLALLEAGQAALPVVASNVGGIPEIIEHGKNGLLTPPNNVPALAAFLTRLLKDPDESRRFGIALQETVRKNFSEERMLAETLALY